MVLSVWSFSLANTPQDVALAELSGVLREGGAAEFSAPTKRGATPTPADPSNCPFLSHHKRDFLGRKTGKKGEINSMSSFESG